MKNAFCLKFLEKSRQVALLLQVIGILDRQINSHGFSIRSKKEAKM